VIDWHHSWSVPATDVHGRTTTLRLGVATVQGRPRVVLQTGMGPPVVVASEAELPRAARAAVSEWINRYGDGELG
jgi:hypothetical protein